MDDPSKKRELEDESASTSGVEQKRLCVEEDSNEDFINDYSYVYDDDDGDSTVMVSKDLLKIDYQSLPPIDWDAEKNDSCEKCKMKLSVKNESGREDNSDIEKKVDSMLHHSVGKDLSENVNTQEERRSTKEIISNSNSECKDVNASSHHEEVKDLEIVKEEKHDSQCSVHEAGCVDNSASGNSTQNGNINCALKVPTQEKLIADLDDKQNPDDEILFIVGWQKKQLSGSKLRLSQESNLIRDMFNREWKDEFVIKIPDVESDAFDFILKFTVDEDIPFINKNQAAKVCNVAKKYNLHNVIQKVVKYMYPNTVDKMWIALNCGVLYDLPVLTEGAMKIIRQYTRDVLISAQFPTISEASLMMILNDEHLDIKSEVEVFNAAVSWAEFQCQAADMEPNPENIRQQLGAAIYCIRFLTLTPKEIGTSCAFLLTPEETLKILNVLQGAEHQSTMKPFSSCTKKREGQTVEIPKQNFPLFCFKFLKTPLTADMKTCSYEKTTVRLSTSIGLVSVLVHALQNTEKTGQFYLEDVTVNVFNSVFVLNVPRKYPQRQEIGSGSFKGFVKYNEYFKVPLHSNTAEPLVLSPGVRAIFKSYTIDVTFNEKRKDPNPPYVNTVRCPDIGQIDGGYIIGFEYYLSSCAGNRIRHSVYTRM